MKRRPLRIAAQVGLVLIAAVAVLAGGAVLFLHTAAGGDLLRGVALRGIDGAIAGQVAVDRVRFGTNRLRLAGVELRDPEGQLVARAREVDVDFSPLALLRGRIALSRVSIVQPELSLRADHRGLNLTRALASRRAPEQPKSSASKPGGNSLELDVGVLDIAGGVVDYRAEETGAQPRHARLEDVHVAAHASLRLDGSRIEGAVDGGARVTAPVPAPLAFHLDARSLRSPAGTGADDSSDATKGLTADADVRVSLGDSVLQATARLAPAGGVTVHIEKLRAIPRLANAFLPGLRVQSPVDVAADLSRDGAIVDVTADVRAGGGQVHVTGTVDTDRRRARSLTVEGRDIDLGAVVASLPRSDLSFTLRADGGGSDLDRLDGALSLVMPPGRLDGQAVGPVQLSARASGGRIEIKPFALALPGLTIAGGGTSSRGQLDADVQVHASDLTRTARSLASEAGDGVPSFAGHGDATVHVGGSIDAPAVDAHGRFASLQVAGQSARDLAFAVRVPDLRRPELGQAQLQCAAAVVAGRALSDVRLDLRSQHRRIAADLAIGGRQTLALSLRGHWTRARRAAIIESLSLASGTARWAQNGPIRFDLGAGATQVTGVDLRAGDQRLRADIDAREQRVTARVDIDRFDLAKLPRPLLPGSVPVLEGVLDLHVDLAGTRRRPELTAHAALVRGRFGRYRGLALLLDGRYAGDRARASINASGLGANVYGTIDVPTRWPPHDLRAPLAADLQLSAADVAQVLSVIQPASAPSVAGRFGAKLHLGGTAGDPTVVLHAEGGGLRAYSLVIGDVGIDVNASGDRPTSAAIRFAGGGTGLGAGRGGLATGTLSLETPLSLQALLHGSWPPRRDWLATRVAARADLRHIDLADLAAIAHRRGAVAGTAALRLDLRGPARAPVGALNLIVSGAHGPRFPETDVRLDAAFGERDVRLAAQVVRRQHLLAWANAIAEIPAARISDREALASAPIHLRLGAGPVDLRGTSLDVLAPAANAPPPAVTTTTTDGRLHESARIEVAVDGTLRRPTVRATAQLRALEKGGAQAGAMRAVLTYADRRALLDAQLTSAAGGEASVRGSATLDLGYPALGRGIDPARVPLDVSLDAKALDLAWMSGLVAPIRSVGGHLTVSARARGEAASPSISGRLEWTDGALGLAGLGGYRAIHLLAHGDEHAIVLDGLDVRSGEGRAYLTGTAKRDADKIQLQLKSKVSRFPIYGQGALLALVSLDASSHADIAHHRAEGTVSIDELHAELAEQPKDLQPLERPDDVVLVSDGHPIDRAEAKKLGRLRAGLRQTSTPAPEGIASAPETNTPFTAHVTVDAPRNLWLRGRDADLEVGLERGFRVEAGDSVRVYGEVSLERGHVDLFGRRLELQSGSTARFAGPPAVPIIDVSAKFVDDKDNLTVLLHAEGPIDKLKINVSAPDHPGLTETQLYTVIVVGHLQSGGDSGGGAAAAVSSSALSSEAGSLVAGVLASQIQKVLSKRLPLDVLSIQTGQGLAGSRLEAGKYVSRDIYVGYVGRSGANPALLENRNAVHVEYQISARWSFDAEYGDAGTGTADLKWTKRY